MVQPRQHDVKDGEVAGVDVSAERLIVRRTWGVRDGEVLEGGTTDLEGTGVDVFAGSGEYCEELAQSAEVGDGLRS